MVEAMQAGTLKQILLITDGRSNEGKDPVAVASMAQAYGITLNVIGILDDQTLNEQGLQEVRQIAEAGGGVHQLVYSKHLPKSVQMVTKKAMNETIQQVVNKELQHIFGPEEEVESLPPERRGQVVEVVEQLGETVGLQVLILVDTSASMKTKIPSVKQALRDLSLSMQAREGRSRFALWTFPGARSEAQLNIDWTNELRSLEQHFTRLSPQGTTPTGPALEQCLRAFMDVDGGADEEGMYPDHAL